MRILTHMIASALLTTGIAGTLAAQKVTQTGPGAGGSPHAKVEYVVGGAHIALSYGRPSLKGRPEAQLMPAGMPWRTGADTATIITTDKSLTFGKIVLAPGSYTINTQPGASEWTFIAGKLSSPGQWGIPYQPTLEIGRAPMTLGKTKASVEQLTLSIDSKPAGGTFRVEWGTTSVSIPFIVSP